MQRKRLSLENRVTDFRNGTIVEMVKEKPIRGYRGRATIQLFNAETGELEVEAVTENVIMDWIAKEAFADIFLYGAIKNNSLSPRTGSPFTYLVLTDAAVPEEETEREILGNIIGWAARNTYSGDSIMRGTLNTVESNYSTGLTSRGKMQVHLVFDFPTHAANGTIRSLYWVPYLIDQYTNYPSVKMASRLIQYRTFDNIVNSGVTANAYYCLSLLYACPNHQLYMDESSNRCHMLCMIDNNLSYFNFDIDTFDHNIEDVIKLRYSDGSPITSFPYTSEACVYFNLTNAEIKILTYTANNTSYKDMPNAYTFYEWTFTLQGAFKDIRSFSRDILKNVDSLYPELLKPLYWHYNDNGQLQLCTHYMNSSTGIRNNVILTMNNALTVVASTTDMTEIIVNLCNSYNEKMHKDTRYTVDDDKIKKMYLTAFTLETKDLLYYQVYDHHYGWATKDWQPHLISQDDYNSKSFSDGMCKYIRGTNILHGISKYNNNIYYYRTPITQFPSAHTLLPSNVIKTETNTMKIQYDFIVDEPDVYAPYDIE